MAGMARNGSLEYIEADLIFRHIELVRNNRFDRKVSGRHGAAPLDDEAVD